MKIYKFLSLFFIAFTLLMTTACRSNDDDQITDTTPGNVQIKFENGFNNLGNIVLGKTTQTSTNGQKHNFTTLKYIVSNITLIDENGGEFKYNYNNPDKGAFIIDQAKAVTVGYSLNLVSQTADGFSLEQNIPSDGENVRIVYNFVRSGMN